MLEPLAALCFVCLKASQIVNSRSRAFGVGATHLKYRTLPTDVVVANSLSAFHRLLKRFLFKQSYPDIIYWRRPVSGPCGGCTTEATLKNYLLIDWCKYFSTLVSIHRLRANYFCTYIHVTDLYIPNNSQSQKIFRHTLTPIGLISNFMQFIDNIAEHTALFPLQLLLLLQLSCLRRSPFALYSAVVVAATVATVRHSSTMTSLLLWRHLHCRHIPCLTSAHNSTCSIDEQFIPVHASDYGYTCEVLVNYSYEQTAMFTVSRSTCLRHMWWHFITIYI